MAASQRPEIGEALPTLATWRRFLSGVLPGIGEDEVTNHSLVTRVSFARFEVAIEHHSNAANARDHRIGSQALEQNFENALYRSFA